MPKEDPIEKLRQVIRDEITNDRKGRDREEQERSNPSWGTLRQIVRETVHEVLNERDAAQPKGRQAPKAKDDDEGGEGKVLGGLFG